MEFREEIKVLRDEAVQVENEIEELEEKAQALSTVLQKLARIRATLADRTGAVSRRDLVLKNVEPLELLETGRSERGAREGQVLEAARIFTDGGVLPFNAREFSQILVEVDPSFPPTCLYNYLNGPNFRKAGRGSYFLVG